MAKCFLCKTESDVVQNISVVYLTHMEQHSFCNDCADMVQPIHGHIRGEVLRDVLDFFNDLEAATTAHFS